MPLKIDDFINFSKNSNFNSERLIKAIDDSYTLLANKKFNNRWRDEIIKNSSK